jgi:glycosyltransferase involved in cell wall biosynthesis
MPKVSVVIPCYNLGQYLNEAVESVLKQTFQDFEIIIVNDGSTDDFTNHLLANYDKPKTRVIKTENRGLPAARNRAIKESVGKYILPLDADDKIERTYLEKAVNIFETKPQIDFVSCWYEEFGERNQKCVLIPFETYELLIRNHLIVASMFKKSCWEKVGGYAEDMNGYQDWNLWIGFLEQGYQYEIIKDYLFFYRVRPNSMVTNSNKKENKIKLIGQIIAKHPDFYKKYLAEIIFANQNMEIRHQQQIRQMINSFSWKITAPLRWFRVWIKEVFKI